MKTVVITGSTRGLGFEMARLFRKNGWNLVINGVNPQRLEKAAEELRALPGDGAVEGFAGSVASEEELQGLLDFAVEKFGVLDIWINNAGVNQPMKAIWELSQEEIDAILNIDLRGAILGSRLAARQMEKQPEGGFIYNLEGYGSNDAMMLGLNLYGTSKRAVTHFTVALAKELEERGSRVKAGRLSPGIMITDFTVKALGGKESIALPEKTKKVYNILGDKPDVVAAHLVKEMLANSKNNAHIQWLTTGKAAWRFMTAGFNKRNFFD
ncbi:MAG: SDR family oxidoreductase [Oscillospiraceae bacterium]|nr:SDR family oxidoreductase [Oscillospiraceae bacterium]